MKHLLAPFAASRIGSMDIDPDKRVGRLRVDWRFTAPVCQIPSWSHDREWHTDTLLVPRMSRGVVVGPSRLWDAR